MDKSSDNHHWAKEEQIFGNLIIISEVLCIIWLEVLVSSVRCNYPAIED